jgi:penicillin-binding protein-related factor A (putative recombinase)
LAGGPKEAGFLYRVVPIHILEKDFQTRFNHWAKANALASSAYELKICKAKSLPYDAVQPHQLRALLTAKHGTLTHKITDYSPEPKPFDCFALVHSNAYVGILFYQKRGDKEFYLIDIDTFIDYRDASTRKSITKDEAKAIATITGILQ